MIKVENIDVMNVHNAIRGCRNPLESWDQSDSEWLFTVEGYTKAFRVGEKDLELALKLIKAGSDHSKFLRQVLVSMDITAPLYWWKEADTYKVATVANSTSTIHTLHKKPITIDMFSVDFFEDKEKTMLNKEIVINEIQEEEEWSDIPDYEGIYKVSSLGKVISLDRYVNHSSGGLKLQRGKTLIPAINSSGYYKVGLCKNGLSKNEYVHRLVAEIFVNNPENKPEVNHKDGNKLNNNSNNLEWVTDKENTQHAHDNGLAKVSSYTRHKVSEAGRKFTMAQAEEIRQKYKNGLSMNDLAKEYETYSSTICNIINHKTYKHIPLDRFDFWRLTIEHLEELRQKFLETGDKKYWRELIQDLPSSFNQTRTWTGNYQTLRNMYHNRKNHKLQEWRDFCKVIEDLPYSELITC